MINLAACAPISFQNFRGKSVKGKKKWGKEKLETSEHKAYSSTGIKGISDSTWRFYYKKE